MNPNYKIWDMLREEEIKEKVKMQRRFCRDRNLPMFSEGKCNICGRNVVDLYSHEECKTTLITSCRWCNNSLTE